MMLKTCLVLLGTMLATASGAQSVTTKISAAYKVFEDDAQLRNGLASLYVIEAKTGKVIFDKNSSIGLAPASTQKIITSASAYELLGKSFRYETAFGYTGNLAAGELKGSLYMKPSGDPTLGSWRWQATKENAVMQRLAAAVQKAGIKQYAGIVVDDSQWNFEAIPDGWIWEDIGNYYGAGADVLNWRENQYDLMLRSGKSLGSEVSVADTRPFLYGFDFVSEAKAAAKGSGDNAYIYFQPGVNTIKVRGTIPAEENNFSISGAMPSPRLQFAATLEDSLEKRSVVNSFSASDLKKSGKQTTNGQFTLLHTEKSPPLDSIVYWFNKRSINLYGEALVKTIAFQKKKTGNTDEGVKLLKEHWKGKGIPETELNMVDGSGLSPLNRVTTHAQVAILQYAKKQSWHTGFYYSLPENNNMKMKSGTIRGVKGFCGYHQSRSGEEYIFSFLVNNYNGSASSLVQKMYRVLDVLK